MRLIIAVTGIVLLIVLVWVTRLREGFTTNTNTHTSQAEVAAGLPDPAQLIGSIRGLMKKVGTPQLESTDMFQNINGLLEKYEKPDNLGHIMNIKDKDPGQLARMYLNINNQ